MLVKKSIVWLLTIIGSVQCFSDPQMDFFDLNINDIMDQRLMPATIFFLDNSVNSSSFAFLNNTKEENSDGDLNNAFSTMGFHRSMMNKYLCNNFIAKEILADVIPVEKKIERRIGTVVSEEASAEINTITDEEPNELLLYDEGSTGYKKWLQKTTTLDDIYKQFSNKQAKPGNNRTRKRSGKSKGRRRQGNEEYSEEDYEEGEVTGFAVHQPMRDYDTDGATNAFDHYPPVRPAVAGSKNAPLPGMGMNFGQMTPPSIANYLSLPNLQLLHGLPTMSTLEGYYPSAQDGYDYGVQSYDDGGGKQIGVKEVMDIALITLAYLSFGMFILQVLMCITMNKSDNNMMMMSMETDMNGNGNGNGNGSNGGGDDGEEEIRRKRRSVLFDTRVKEVNELSRRVLISIDAVLHAKKDDGACLQRVLCDLNGYARDKSDGRKIWIPVWSLGLSWLSSRFTSAESPFAAILSSLKATAFGLGKADCSKIFSDCEFDGFGNG